MKKYNWLVSLLIGLPALVLVGAFAISAVRNRPVQESPHVVAGAVLYEIHEVQNIDAKTTIDINIASSGISDFDALVLKQVQAIEQQFRNEVIAVEEMNDWGMPPTLQIRTSYSSYGDFTSAVLDIYAYAGGAHGTPQVRTITYNNQIRALATLDDVFGGGEFIQVLSSFVLADLLTRDNTFEDYILEGSVGPKAENFDAWAVGEEGLTIYFDPYEVAPFSSGMMRVTIPWEKVDQM